MEDKFQVTTNGTELEIGDAELIGEQAALADDRVLWELLRTTPEAGDKLIVRYGVRGDAPEGSLTSAGLIHGNTADATIRIMPFRFCLGSVAPTPPLDRMRDLRSGYHVGASDPYTELVVAANASGNPRWDLIYATITPETNRAGVTRFIKDPTTQVVTPTSVVRATYNAVTVSQLAGTPGASPAKPALPADSGGSYHVALAYVWVPNGFNGSTSIVERGYIHEVAPCATLHDAAKGGWEPANAHYEVGGAVDVNQGATATTTRAACYLPSTMVGEAKRVILIQTGPAPDSFADGDVVDDSIDWRHRYFKFHVQVALGSGAADRFASDRAVTGVTPMGGTSRNGQADSGVQTGFGQSFLDDTPAGFTVADGNGSVMWLHDTFPTGLDADDQFLLYVRDSDGALVYKVLGSPAAQVMVWLEATAQYANYGTV